MFICNECVKAACVVLQISEDIVAGIEMRLDRDICGTRRWSSLLKEVDLKPERVRSVKQARYEPAFCETRRVIAFVKFYSVHVVKTCARVQRPNTLIFQCLLKEEIGFLGRIMSFPPGPTPDKADSSLSKSKHDLIFCFWWRRIF